VWYVAAWCGVRRPEKKDVDSILRYDPASRPSVSQGGQGLSGTANVSLACVLVVKSGILRQHGT
jgi:hypothetical protein